MKAARELISRGGPAATSTQAVAVAAGVSHGTIFLHFPRREALLTALVEEWASALHARLQDKVASLESELDGQLALLMEVETLYAILLKDESLLPPAARNALRSIDETLITRLVNALGSESESHPLRPLPPRLFAETWLALVQRAMRRDTATASGLSARGAEIKAYSLDLLRS